MSDVTLSVKFGFLGLGMGGCSIANECARIQTGIVNNKNPYTALLINTNEVDLKKIKEAPTAVKYQLKGYEKGAGRNIEIGEKAFFEHKDKITEKVVSYFNDREFIWVVTGLGGGTGTGSVIEAVRVLHNNGFKGKFGLILTLPRDKEGLTVIENALERLQIIAKAMRGLGSIILVDNQKLYRDFVENKPDSNITEYLDYSNKFIARTLHEINVVTSSYDPVGAYHFDGSEFLNAIKTPGILSFGKLSIKENTFDVENQSTYLPEFKSSINNGILSDGYNFKTATRAAVSMIASNQTANRAFTISFINKIEEMIDEMSPNAGEKSIATYADSDRRVIDIYSIFAGLSLPSRISQLVEVADELKNSKEQDDIEDDALSALGAFSRQKQADEEFELDDLLSGKNEVASALDEQGKKEKSDDPFDF